MCVNYQSAGTAEIEAIIAEDIQGDVFESMEIWPGYEAPIVRRDAESGRRIVEPAVFGLVPPWWREPKPPRNTVNARSETVAEKPSFKTAWSKSRFCLIPLRWYYEPNYESGKPVRWSIRRNDAEAFCVAGIWSWWPAKEDRPGIATFAMLTVNADEHPVMRRFHAPADEKRSLVHVLPDEYDAWLSASSELARVMLTLPDADALAVAPAPRPPRTKKVDVAG